MIHELQICSIIENHSSFTKLSFTMVFFTIHSNGAVFQGALLVTFPPIFLLSLGIYFSNLSVFGYPTWIYAAIYAENHVFRLFIAFS